jgi:hypothetical protein
VLLLLLVGVVTALARLREQVKGWLHRQAHFLEIVLKVLHKGLNAVFAAEFRIDG